MSLLVLLHVIPRITRQHNEKPSASFVCYHETDVTSNLVPHICGVTVFITFYERGTQTDARLPTDRASVS